VTVARRRVILLGETSTDEEGPAGLDVNVNDAAAMLRAEALLLLRVLPSTVLSSSGVILDVSISMIRYDNDTITIRYDKIR
jgi:hypothetical protein